MPAEDLIHSDGEQDAADPRPITNDPVYYVMVAVFALLTTALPAGLGQPRFLPIAQALALSVFLGIPLSVGLWRRGLVVMVLWLSTAMVSMVALTLVIPDKIEGALTNGFGLRTDTIAWAAGASTWPGSPRTDFVSYAVELAGVALGSIATAGLVGNWFLMRIVNATGFSLGILLRTVEGIAGILLSVPLWSLAWIGGLAGIVLLLSQPILSGQWSVRFYLNSQRSLVLWSVLLLIIATVLGIALPAWWQELIVSTQ